MKSVILALSVLIIPRYLLRFVLLATLITPFVIWLFNLTALIGAGSAPLVVLVNFFSYELNETSVLLLLISVVSSLYLTLRSYLSSIGKEITSVWIYAMLLVVTFTGLLVPVLLSLAGVNQFGGSTRTFTDVILVLALAVSVYSVVWAGVQIEPAVRAEIDQE